MDTDDLTEMAWGVIVSASRVSDTLKADLGSMASRFRTEDEWLGGVRAHLVDIFEPIFPRPATRRSRRPPRIRWAAKRNCLFSERVSGRRY